MPHAIRIGVFVGSLILAAAGCAQSDGGTYTVTFERSKPIPISSLSFENTDPFASGRLARGAEIEVTMECASAFESLQGIVRACLDGRRFAKVIATYMNVRKSVEYTVELKKVTIKTFTFPGLERDSKASGNPSWILVAESGQLNYEQLKDPGGLSKANHDRLERARARMQANMWEQVKHKPWGGLHKDQATGSFSFSLEGVNTAGVAAVGPVGISKPFKAAGGSGTPAGSFVLTVNAAQAVEFANASKAGTEFTRASLSYHLSSESGKGEEIKLTFAKIVPKSCTPVDPKSANSLVAVELQYSSLEVSGGG